MLDKCLEMREGGRERERARKQAGWDLRLER